MNMQLLKPGNIMEVAICGHGNGKPKYLQTMCDMVVDKVMATDNKFGELPNPINGYVVTGHCFTHNKPMKAWVSETPAEMLQNNPHDYLMSDVVVTNYKGTPVVSFGRVKCYKFDASFFEFVPKQEYITCFEKVYKREKPAGMPWRYALQCLWSHMKVEGGNKRCFGAPGNYCCSFPAMEKRLVRHHNPLFFINRVTKPNNPRRVGAWVEVTNRVSKPVGQIRATLLQLNGYRDPVCEVLYADGRVCYVQPEHLRVLSSIQLPINK